MYSPVFLSWPTTSGSPPVLSISLSDHSFSVFASSFACTSAHSRPLWCFFFFQKWFFNSFVFFFSFFCFFFFFFPFFFSSLSSFFFWPLPAFLSSIFLFTSPRRKHEPVAHRRRIQLAPA